DQLERNLDAAAAAGDVAPVLGKTFVTKVGRFVESELEMHGIGRHDGGQEGCVAGRSPGNEVARRYAAVADAPVDRCAQLSVFEVELGLAQRGLGAADRCLRV